MSRVKRHTERWQLILLVDQSGSMVESVIHSAVMAACLGNLPGMDTRLVVFDSEVVDLSADVCDPVELLMKVQLGGGTSIAKAVAGAHSCILTPQRSLIVLISDFDEGVAAMSWCVGCGPVFKVGSRFLVWRLWGVMLHLNITARWQPDSVKRGCKLPP